MEKDGYGFLTLTESIRKGYEEVGKQVRYAFTKKKRTEEKERRKKKTRKQNKQKKRKTLILTVEICCDCQEKSLACIFSFFQ